MTDDTADKRFQEALSLRKKGDLAGARDVLLDVIAVAPHFAAPLAVLGGVYWDLGELDLAIDSFRKATTLAPTSEVASLGVFHCLWQQARCDDALVEMRRFLSTSDSDDYRRIREELRERGIESGGTP